MKVNKILGIATLGLASVALLAACGSSSSSSNKSSGSSSSKVTTVNVAISSDSNPYEYTENGKMTGYEYEVLQDAAKNLPQYKFVYQTYQDDALLTAIDGGRADIAVNNFGKTAAREQKYLFSYPIDQGINAIFSSKKENFTKISQLGGSNTTIPTGTNYGDILTKWNKENPSKKITINYSQNTLADRLQGVANGQIGFLFASKSAAENLVKEHAITGIVDHVPTDLDSYPYFKTYAYFVLADNQTQLQKDLNAQIKKLAENGTLKTLSEKYFGDDQVPDASQFN